MALILARGGSKGIKLKNLSKIGNLTLLGRSISIIKNSRKFSDIWVSTDHVVISFEALKCKYVFIILYRYCSFAIFVFIILMHLPDDMYGMSMSMVSNL